MPDRPLRGHPTPLTDQSIVRAGGAVRPAARLVDPLGAPGHLLAVAVRQLLARGSLHHAAGPETPEDREPVPTAGERDVADRHRPRHQAAALAVGGAAVHEPKLPHLVAVHDFEGNLPAVLGLAAVAHGLAAADRHEGHAPD